MATTAATSTACTGDRAAAASPRLSGVPQRRTVVLRTMRSGAEAIAWPHRAARIDPDVFVVCEQGVATTPVEPESEAFAVELPVPADSDAPAAFTHTLRCIESGVGRRLVELARATTGSDRVAVAGDDAAELWSALVAEEAALRARAARIACAKPRTRASLFRRVLLSADYIHANYAEPLRLERLAAVSSLSPYHFARLFTQVMDTPPHAFVTRKRVAVARRLLAAGVSRGEAAERSGLGSRSTLYRHLR